MTSTETLIAVLGALARESQSTIRTDGGTANMVLLEAADRLEELAKKAAMYEHVRTLNPRDFADMWTENMCGGGAFDDLVLADMDKRKKGRA